MKLTVLNPKGNDPEQYFEDHAGDVSTSAHAPINYHAYAACLAGSFQRDVNKTIDLGQPVLMLVRSDLKLCLKTLKQVKEAGLTVAVALKETGYHQFHKLLDNAKKLQVFRDILRASDGVISPTHALLPVYQALRVGQSPETCRFVATPYPVTDPRWDFSLPCDQRRGIFVGTRDLKTASRNHLQSLILIGTLARELGCPVGLVNSDGNKLEPVLESLDFPLAQTDIKTRMSYPDYLRFMAQHRVVFQLDQSMVPGQVAGDCCLTRLIAAGGNGSVERLVFAPFCASGQDRGELLVKLRALLQDNEYYENALAVAQENAREYLSYEAIARELRQFYGSIKGTRT